MSLTPYRYIGLIARDRGTSQGWFGDHFCEPTNEDKLVEWFIPLILDSLSSSYDVRVYWPYTESDNISRIRRRVKRMIARIEEEVDKAFHTAPEVGSTLRLMNAPPPPNSTSLRFMQTRRARCFAVYSGRP